jgi:hypothetical protein
MLQKISLNLLITLLTVFVFIATANAQAPGQTEEQKMETDAKSAAKGMCSCMNLFFDALHPKLVDLMTDMLEVGEEKAQANFFTYLMSATPEEQALINKDIERMEDIDVELDAFCGEVIERFSVYDDNKEFEVKMISHLSQLPECKNVYSVMKLGQEDGED